MLKKAYTKLLLPTNFSALSSIGIARDLLLDVLNYNKSQGILYSALMTPQILDSVFEV